MPAEKLFVGLMSGTSMDGIDAVLIDLSGNTPRLIGHHQHTYPTGLRDRLAALCQPGVNEIDRLGEADIQVGETFAQAVLELLQKHAVPASTIRAIGSHGQTVRHRPRSKHPFTLQIGDPNILAQRTGITTVSDFRRRDMAAGGQGAPLVPAFHAVLFRHPEINRVILNIGGIANITWLPASASAEIHGFDTGPGNTLLDGWIRVHQAVDFDAGGRWAAGGKVIPELLSRLLADPYFSLPPPKSTGTEYFNLAWLVASLAGRSFALHDVQTTLAELTAQSITAAIRKHCLAADLVFVCGGGAHNRDLLGRLANQLPDLEIKTTLSLGIDPDWVAAIAFAWLAKRRLEGEPGNLPAVTGARQAVILGACMPRQPSLPPSLGIKSFKYRHASIHDEKNRRDLCPENRS